MQMCPSDKRSDMQFVFPLQRDKEYIVICHFHGIYRHSCIHGTEEGEIVDIPCAYCPVLWACDEDVAILDYFDSCHWAAVVVKFRHLVEIVWKKMLRVMQLFRQQYYFYIRVNIKVGHVDHVVSHGKFR